jgi:hypothetical protein
MSKQILFMETTKIKAGQTASQIVSFLAQACAREVLMQYDGKGKLTGLKFSLDIPRHGTQIFVLPARVDPIFKIINGRRKYAHDQTVNKSKDLEQSERVAWRQLFRWVQAQLALIQTGMVEAAEVFLPYMQAKDGKTFWEYVLTGGQLALPPGLEDNVRKFPEAR